MGGNSRQRGSGHLKEWVETWKWIYYLLHKKIQDLEYKILERQEDKSIGS